MKTSSSFPLLVVSCQIYSIITAKEKVIRVYKDYYSNLNVEKCILCYSRAEENSICLGLRADINLTRYSRMIFNTFNLQHVQYIDMTIMGHAILLQLRKTILLSLRPIWTLMNCIEESCDGLYSTNNPRYFEIFILPQKTWFRVVMY